MIGLCVPEAWIEELTRSQEAFTKDTERRLNEIEQHLIAEGKMTPEQVQKIKRLAETAIPEW